MQLLSVVKMVTKVTEKNNSKQKLTQSQSYLICNNENNQDKKIFVELNHSIVEKIDDFVTQYYLIHNFSCS